MESKRSLVAALILSVSAFLAQPAQAGVFTHGEHVDLAGAVWTTQTDHSFSDLTLRIHDLDDRSWDMGPMNSRSPGIIMFYTRQETDPDTGAVTEVNYEAFSGSSENDFSFERSLSGATAHFSLTAWGYQCRYQAGDPHGGPQGITEGPDCVDLPDLAITGDISWTGVGDIVRTVTNTRGGEAPLAVFGVHSVSAHRTAVVAGSIAADGFTFTTAPTDFGILLRGKLNQTLVTPPGGASTGRRG